MPPKRAPKKATTSKPTAPSVKAEVPIPGVFVKTNITRPTGSGLRPARAPKTFGDQKPEIETVALPTTVEKLDIRSGLNRLKGIKPGVVVSLVMSIATAEEIQGSGRCEIKESKMETSTGCVLDPAMGPAFKAGPACSKCQGNIKTCPGHFGFFTLAVPIYNPAYIAHVQKIMNLFCFECWRQSKNEVYKFVNEYKAQHTSAYDMSKFADATDEEKRAEAEKIQIDLTEEALRNSPVKFKIMPLFDPLTVELNWPDILGYRRLNLIDQTKRSAKCACDLAKVTYKVVNDHYIEQRLEGKDRDQDVLMNPREIQDFFEAIDNDVDERGVNRHWSRKLGLGLGENKLKAMIMTHFPVLPNTQRPSEKEADDKDRHHPLTVQYASIINDNQILANAIGGSGSLYPAFDTMQNKDVGTQTKGRGKKINEPEKRTSLKSYYDDMNRKIYALFYAKDEKSEEGFDYERSGSSVPVSLTTITNGKYGLLRKDIMGKPSDFSGRAVVIGDPNIDVDEVGISRVFADSVTIPESIISEEDIEKWSGELPKAGVDGKMEMRLITRVDRGRAKIFVTPETKVILKIGDIVRRKLVDGDIIVLSRQPVLHKGGLMGFRARVFNEGGNVLRINPAVTGPFNADFDGDEMNFAVPQDLKTRNETARIMMVTNCLRGDQYSSPWVGLIQNTIISSAILTRADTIVEEGLKFAMWTDATETYQRRNPNGVFRTSEADFQRELFEYRTPINPVSGRAVISYFFPRNFRYERREKGKEPIIIEKGLLISGVLTKADLGKTSNGIIDAMLEQPGYGAETVIVFLSAITRGLYTFIHAQGSTIGAGDCKLQKLWDPVKKSFSIDPQDTIDGLLEDAKKAVVKLQESAGSGDLGRHAEKEIRDKLSELGDRVNAIAKAGGVDIVALKNRLESERTNVKLNDAMQLATMSLPEELNMEDKALQEVIELKIIDESPESYARAIADLAKRIKTGKLGSKGAKDLDDITLVRETLLLKCVGQQLSTLTDAQIKAHEFNSMSFKLPEPKVIREALVKIVQEAINTRMFITGANQFSNRFLLIVYSGAKGTATNYAQVLGLVGQQEFEGARFQPQGALKRTMPFYQPGEVDPVSQGMCFSSFANGLTLAEYLQHAMASRGNIVESNLKPAITGYFYRRAMIMMGDIRAAADGSARDEVGRIVQFAYGGDGFDPRRLINVGKGSDPQFINVDMAAQSIRTAEGKTEFNKNLL